MNIENKKMATTREVMEFLGVSRSTLYRYKKERGFPEYKLNPTTSRYDMDEVKRWVEAKRLDR